MLPERCPFIPTHTASHILTWYAKLKKKSNWKWPLKNSKMLISAIVLCIRSNLSMTWHSFLEIFSLPVCAHECVMRAGLQRCPQHVLLSPVLLLDLFPYNIAWCLWQVYLNYLCKAKSGEPGIKAAWWRGKKRMPENLPRHPLHINLRV